MEHQTPSGFPGNFRKRKVLGTLWFPSGLPETLGQANSPPSPSGIRGIRWVAQSIDLWRVSQPHFEGAMKYSDRHLAGLSAGPPDRVELIGAGSLGYGTGPSFG